MKEFTAEQVAKHCTQEDAWIIIASNVYRITDFMDAHPGGKRILLPYLGKDASEIFNQYHMVKTVLAKYSPSLLIGSLQGAHIEDAPDPLSDTFGDLVAFGDPSWYQGWKTPYYNDSHKRLRQWTRDFVELEMIPYIHGWETNGKIPMSLYKKCGLNGILAASFGIWPTDFSPCVPPVGIKPEEWDGFHGLVIGDELTRVASFGTTAAINLGPSIALPVVYKFGNQEMRKRVCTSVLNGDKTICLAITEPYAGSDVANIQTTAVSSDNGETYVINGEKKWITCGTWSDYFVLTTRTGQPGMKGLTLFLIERGTPGLRTRPVHCQGNVGSGTAFVILENVTVPKANMIGELNKGERMGICGGSIRSARICYEEAMKYSNKRKTFGKFLFEHGVIRNKLAHMARQIEASQSWLEALVYQLGVMDNDEANIKLGGPIALLKAQSSITFEYCAREASQIMGGISYTKGGMGEKVERLYRDVRGAAIPGGSEEIMLDLGIRQALKVSQFMGAKM